MPQFDLDGNRLAAAIVADAPNQAQSRSFAETVGVSDAERRAELTKVRKKAGPDAAERVSVRFDRVVAAFKQSEGRSPGMDDREVWAALAQIVREEARG